MPRPFLIASLLVLLTLLVDRCIADRLNRTMCTCITPSGSTPESAGAHFVFTYTSARLKQTYTANWTCHEPLETFKKSGGRYNKCVDIYHQSLKHCSTVGRGPQHNSTKHGTHTNKHDTHTFCYDQEAAWGRHERSDWAILDRKRQKLYEDTITLDFEGRKEEVRTICGPPCAAMGLEAVVAGTAKWRRFDISRIEVFEYLRDL